MSMTVQAENNTVYEIGFDGSEPKQNLMALVGTEAWNCDGHYVTPAIRKAIIGKVVSVFEDGLIARLKDFGNTATLMDFLHEETVEQYPFRHEHGDDFVDLVAEFLYGEWDVQKTGMEDHASIATALVKLDVWYEELLIKDILIATKHWRTHLSSEM